MCLRYVVVAFFSVNRYRYARLTYDVRTTLAVGKKGENNNRPKIRSSSIVDEEAIPSEIICGLPKNPFKKSQG